MATTGEPLLEEVSLASNEVTVGHPSPAPRRRPRTPNPKYQEWSVVEPGMSRRQ